MQAEVHRASVVHVRLVSCPIRQHMETPVYIARGGPTCARASPWCTLVQNKLRVLLVILLAIVYWTRELRHMEAH